MIRSEFTTTHFGTDGRQVASLDWEATGDDPAEDLPAKIIEAFAVGMVPREGERLVLAMPTRPIHVTLGVGTHHIRKRHLRRLLDRLWKPDEERPPVATAAAFLLLSEGRCTIRNSPFTGLTAWRD